MVHGLSKTQRLSIAIGISFTFFAAEISVGFYTHSLALVADAFHYLNDLVGFIVAFAAFKISERENSPKALSFGWQRASILGSFFNGAFLLALGLSIFLQSLERFVSLQHVQNPMLIMTMGCIGLMLNAISVIFLHEHDDHEVAHGNLDELAVGNLDELAVGNLDELAVGNASESNLLAETTNPHAEHRHKVDISKSKGHSHDLGMLAVLMHIAGDALNNIGVIIAAAIIWKAKYEGRFYADPAVGMGIAIMITLSGLPIVKRSGQILLESMPLGVSLEDVKHDLEKVSGALSIHELHIWRLSQHKALASAHVFTTDDSLANWMVRAKLINECLHAYGIHSSTLQPELVASIEEAGQQVAEEADRRRDWGCQIVCGTLCEELTCCGREKFEAVTRAVDGAGVHTRGDDVV